MNNMSYCLLKKLQIPVIIMLWLYARQQERVLKMPGSQKRFWIFFIISFSNRMKVLYLHLELPSKQGNRNFFGVRVVPWALSRVDTVLTLLVLTVQIAKSPKISVFLTYMTALSAASKCHVVQKVRNYHKTKNPFKVKKLRGSITVNYFGDVF